MRHLSVALVVLAVAAGGCDKKHDKSLCERYADLLRGCGLLTPGTLNCTGIQANAQALCEADCRFAATCEDIGLLVCDYTFSDEMRACFDACNERFGFHCADGSETVPMGWQCDGEDDCADGSDEAGCPTFTCADGLETIPEGWVCDGFYDCTDLSDEDGCDGIITFACREGSVEIPRDWVCDGEADCPDGSDEEGCADLICP
jgi:hypothetical protein